MSNFTGQDNKTESTQNKKRDIARKKEELLAIADKRLDLKRSTSNELLNKIEEQEDKILKLESKHNEEIEILRKKFDKEREKEKLKLAKLIELEKTKTLKGNIND